MQADGEGQEPWLGTITWQMPNGNEQRSGTGVLIGPDIVCTTAQLLYDAPTGSTIVTGTFDLGRVRGPNAPREVDVFGCYIPPWYICYENARSPLSRFHNFAFVKLTRKVPGAPRLAMSDALSRLTGESWLTLYHPATSTEVTDGRTGLTVTDTALRYAREDLTEHILDVGPLLLCLTTAGVDPTALPVLFAGELAGLAVAERTSVRKGDNSTIFGVEILLSSPYMRWERENAENKFARLHAAKGDYKRRRCLDRAAATGLGDEKDDTKDLAEDGEKPASPQPLDDYWKFVDEARQVHGDRSIWPRTVLCRARTIARDRATGVRRLWHELEDYAADLDQRSSGQQPHSMLEHLCQRVGDAQRGVRPPVRVHVNTPQGLRYAEVNAATFSSVYDAASRIRWTDADDTGWSKLKLLTRPATRSGSKENSEDSGWRPFAESAWGRRWIDEWSTMLMMPAELKRRSVEFTAVVQEAGQAITHWVEPEVLTLIGWPKIQVHKDDDSTEFQADDRAHYTAQTQTIHIKVHAMNRVQLLHEFGHHLEEQGPVEVWCGLASYLMAWAEGRPLAEPAQSRRVPGYGWVTTEDPLDYGQNPPIPELTYALSYYPDGGTELIAMGLQSDIAAQSQAVVRWQMGAQGSDPAYLWYLLQAIRPQQCLKYGIAVPTLLDRT